MAIETSVHLAGIVTLVGAVLYAIADILLLAYNVGPLQEIPSTAIDFETGETVWSYVADGPVRLAPSWADGRIYFGSDESSRQIVEVSKAFKKP